MYHCFNCEASGSFLQLYSELKSLTIDESKKELFNYNPDDLIQILSSKKKRKIKEVIEYENFNHILNDCLTVNSETTGYIETKYKELLIKFLKDRNLPPDVNIFVAYKGPYQSRIIIPIYDENNDIIYFQGRRLDDNMPRKYDNPTLKKSNVILNKHKFNKERYIIITEGIIDALSIGDSATSILGKNITDEFIENIKPYTNKGIIIALDNDKAGIDSLKYFMKHSNYNKQVKYFLFPKKYNLYKDINNYVSKENDVNVYDFIVNNSHTYESTYVKLHL